MLSVVEPIVDSPVTTTFPVAWTLVVYRLLIVSAFDTVTFPVTLKVVRPVVAVPATTTFPVAYTFVVQTFWVTSAFATYAFPDATLSVVNPPTPAATPPWTTTFPVKTRSVTREFET